MQPGNGAGSVVKEVSLNQVTYSLFWLSVGVYVCMYVCVCVYECVNLYVFKCICIHVYKQTWCECANVKNKKRRMDEMEGERIEG